MSQILSSEPHVAQPPAELLEAATPERALMLRAAPQTGSSVDGAAIARRAALSRNRVAASIDTLSRAITSPVEAGDGERECAILSLLAVMQGGKGEPLADTPKAKDDAPRERLLALCRVNRIRWRTVTLERDWWKGDAGTMVALLPGGEIAALLVKGGRYHLAKPGEPLAPFRPEADELTGKALVLYWPLPDRALTGGAVIAHVVRHCRGDLFTLFSISAVVALLTLAVPIGAGVLVGAAIPSQDLLTIFEFGALLVLIALTGFAINIAAQVASARIEAKATTLLEGAIVDRLLRLPMTFFASRSTGELTQRTLAVTQLERMVTVGTIGALLSGVFSLVSLGLMVVVAPSLALVAVALALTFGVVAAVAGASQVARSREQLVTGGEVTSRLFELASGIETVRMAAAEAPVLSRWAALFARQQSAHFRAERLRAGMDAFATIFLSAGTLMVFILAGALHGAGAGPSTPHIVTFLTAFTAFMGGLGKLSNTLLQVAHAVPFAEFAGPILRATPEPVHLGEDPGRLRGAIAFHNVRFSYGSTAGDSADRSGPPVLDGLSFAVSPGEAVALVGASGCGKSTAARLLLGFEQPGAGSITVDGQDIRRLDRAAMRRQFGTVMQSATLMPGTIFDNIAGNNHALTERDVARAAERVGLSDDIAQMPMGYQTVVSDTTGGLSGGQVQRILLARAIAGDPAVVILDEATSALDNRTQAIVTDTLGAMSATRVIIAHRLSTIMNVDKIIVLDNGRVLESGSFDALIQAGGPFADLARGQLEHSSSGVVHPRFGRR